MFRNMKEDHHEWLEIHYFTPSSYEKAGAAWPIRLGANIAKPNYHIGPRITPYYYLLFVVEGEGTFIQSNRTYRLRPNDLFCLFPQVTHEYYTNPDALLKKVFFAFDGKFALQLLERIGLGPYTPHLDHVLTADILELMEQFFQIVTTPERHTDLAKLGIFHQIIDSLAARKRKIDGAIAPPVDWLQEGKDYLEIHYADGITVESVAEYVGVERTYFTRQFTKTYGLSPMKYLQKLKMTEAQLLIDQTSYTLAEIAQTVGFPDLPSFSKAFKKYTGMSPAYYRKRAKMEDVPTKEMDAR
ncbi:helix-turn-helix domain-containing protein [Paenibacillus thermoaerophilus]|uniref:Helix-turn-helix domain-containing protein n=1 Tax=Paenibacillus thermoaerophilus TaxID=1215385 RepID=A0ABW2V9I2_9BACL|nr:AraC family transcriptional regulator [Paenibacillus thermoaerophilus]TMV07290.1 AraC family transcriptional regulator [Paenibacillus thermoaerophilus]